MNRPQQYLTYAADETPAFRAAMVSFMLLVGLVIAPWTVGGLWTRVFLLLGLVLIVGMLLSRGYRVKAAVREARAADPDALVVPMRAVVVDPSRSGGKYWEDALIRVAADGILTWTVLDSAKEHSLTREQIDDVRVEYPQLPNVYPHIVIAESGGAELWFFMMKPRAPMWRTGATHTEMLEAAAAIRARIRVVGE